MLQHCYVLSRGGLDPEFGFGFGVPEAGVGMDGDSGSRSLHQLNFHVWYLARGGGLFFFFVFFFFFVILLTTGPSL